MLWEESPLFLLPTSIHPLSPAPWREVFVLTMHVARHSLFIAISSWPFSEDAVSNLSLYLLLTVCENWPVPQSFRCWQMWCTHYLLEKCHKTDPFKILFWYVKAFSLLASCTVSANLKSLAFCQPWVHVACFIYNGSGVTAQATRVAWKLTFRGNVGLLTSRRWCTLFTKAVACQRCSSVCEVGAALSMHCQKSNITSTHGFCALPCM
jgi:hypothetical protein